MSEAFDQFELTQMLRNEMNVRLDRVVSPGRFDQVVFELLAWSERQGREAELIRAAFRVKPREDAIRDLYGKYGMAPGVNLQQGGISLLATPQPSTDPALEKTVKHYLPTLDVGLWREQLAKMEGRVCRVEVGDADNTMGTGFLVGSDALLTNYHVLQSVINDRTSAAAVRFRFDYKLLADSTESPGVVVGLHATDWYVDHSPCSLAELMGTPDIPPPTGDELDYALVRLDRPLGHDSVDPAGAASGIRRGWIRVPDVDHAISDQSLFILQHPRREPLKLVMDTQADVRPVHDGRRLRYATTTDGGSSGAPCLNSKWSLLALHHYGDPAFNQPKFNQGIPIGVIRDRLRRIDKASVLGGDAP